MTSKPPHALMAVLVSGLASLVAFVLLWLRGAPGILRDLQITLATLACGLAVVASLVAALAIVRTFRQPPRRPRPQPEPSRAQDAASRSPHPPPRSRPDPSLRYRDAVEVAWADGKLNHARSMRLHRLEGEIGLERDQAREIEREIMGGVKEEVVTPEEPPVEEEVVVPEEPRERIVYHAAVEIAWADGTLNEAEKQQLGELELALKLPGSRAEEVEREIMGGTREERVSLDGDEGPRDPSEEIEQWMNLVEECAGVVNDLDRHMGSFDPARREVADHVILKLAEGLERSGVDLILDDEDFDSRRHQSVEAKSGTVSGATIAETVSPGFAVGRRVLRKAQVRVE